MLPKLEIGRPDDQVIWIKIKEFVSGYGFGDDRFDLSCWLEFRHSQKQIGNKVTPTWISGLFPLQEHQASVPYLMFPELEIGR